MSTPKQIDTPDTEPLDHPVSPEETASKLGVIAAICFLLPVAYFLSVGPAAWAFENDYIPSAMKGHVEAFYWPLFYLDYSWVSFHWLYRQYLELWGVTP